MNHELGSRGQEDFPSLDGRGEGRVLGISYDSLSSEVRPYADNLEAQIWAVFAKYGVARPPHPNPLPQGERVSTSPSPLRGEGRGEGVEHPLELLKAKNPTTEDLEHLSDLLEQLDHIRKTGETMERTKREYPHLYLETQLKEAREILGAENVISPEEVASVWFPSTLTPPSSFKGEGKVGLPFEIPPLPYSREDLEKARELGMFLILRISHDQEGHPLTAARMNELLEPRLDALNQGKLLFTDWYKDEPFFTNETPTTPSYSPPSEKGEKPPSAEWKLVTKDLLPNSTGKNYLDQTILLRDTLAKHDWLTDEEASEVTDQKLEAIRSLVDSNKETELQEAARILSQLKLTQHYRRTLSGAFYDIATFFFSRNERLLEYRYDWGQTRHFQSLLVTLGRFDRGGAHMGGGDPSCQYGDTGVVLSC